MLDNVRRRGEGDAKANFSTAKDRRQAGAVNIMDKLFLARDVRLSVCL